MLKLNNELIKEYEKLVYKIIINYANDYNKDDLFQEGMMGIIDASRTYDEKSNTKFSTFAYMHILGRVLKCVREDRNMKISRDLIKDYKKVLITKDYIYKTYGRPASEEEICKVLNMDNERLDEVLRYNESEISINKVIGDSENIELADIIYNKEEIDKIDKLCLKDALSGLDPKERDLIYKRYYENMTQTDIAKENNISQVKVYRYERKILDKLKNKIAG